jgi:hypothetical protein
MPMHCFTAVVVNIKVLSEWKSPLKRPNSLYGAKIKTQFSHIIYGGRSCSFLTSAVIMWEMSKLGRLIRWCTREMWGGFLVISCRYWRMDNVQKHYNCINTPSLETFRRLIIILWLWEKSWAQSNESLGVLARRSTQCMPGSSTCFCTKAPLRHFNISLF